MKSILLQMYDMELECQNRHYTATKELMRLHGKREYVEQELYNKLEAAAPELSREVDRVLDYMVHEFSFEMPEVFVDGFKMGAKMMIEIYQNDYSHGDEDEEEQH